MTTYEDFKLKYELFWGQPLNIELGELAGELCHSRECKDCPFEGQCSFDGEAFINWLKKDA